MLRQRHVETSKLNGIKKDDDNNNTRVLNDGKRSSSVSPVRKAPVQPDYWTADVKKTLLLLSIVSLMLRFFLINEPSEVVFDEVHFGGFASNYLRREYFFDVHPPLGKMLIAAVGYLFGYDGSFTFGSIGLSYINSVAPYVALRTFMVFLSVGSIVLSFATMVELGFHLMAAGLATALLVFDNALVVQSRLILLDSPMIFFISAAVYSWVKFRQQRRQAFSVNWWTWLLVTGLAIGGATSIKMVGLFTVLLVGIATIIDLWELADYKRHLTDKTLIKHFLARVLGLVVVPLAVYLGSYYVHFLVLNKTGSGDNFMSVEFQTQLIGNQMHELSREVKYGQSIRLKSRMEDVYLHSHTHNYPKIHDDGKVSSEGQQVTGYPAKDPNNIWKILGMDENGNGKVKNGEKVRLLHVQTNKVLYTHDVASPLTRTNMEVTVADLEDNEKYNATLWTVDIVKGKPGDTLKALSKQVRFLNNVHGVALMNHQQPLPKWGFGQREINGDKRAVDESCKWIVTDIEDPIQEEEQALLKKKEKPKLSFLQKFVELQLAQVRHNAALIDNHPFKSDPMTWPFVLRGVSYWDKNKMGRIYLLGNPVGWYLCIMGTFLYCLLAVRDLIKERRNGNKQEEVDHYANRFFYRTSFILLAWGLHYLPFFTMARTLYLHHYLPAFTMSAMLLGAVCDYQYRRTKHLYVTRIMFTLMIAATILTFLNFIAITYGTRISTEALIPKKWLSSWDWP